MSPEIFSGGVADGRSDLFSLGVVLYQLLTGRKPFEGGSVSRTIYRVLHEEPAPPSSLRAAIPPGWDRVTKKLLAKSPEARYPTAGQLLLDLDRLSEEDSPSPKKPRSFLLVAAAVLTLGIGVLGFLVTRSEDAPAAPLLPSPAVLSLPLRFVARHEHRVGHCTGDLSLAESGLVFEAPRHGEWRFGPEQIESLLQRSETDLELRARMRGESETFRFTFLRPALEEGALREYRERILGR
jgi:serine/threonine protein kinase